MRVLAATQQDLSELNDALHDRWLDLDGLRHEGYVVRIPLSATPSRRPRDSSFDRELRIEPVEEVVLTDTECIGSYDLNFIEVQEAGCRLRFHFNIPVELEIRLRQLPATLALKVPGPG